MNRQTFVIAHYRITESEAALTIPVLSDWKHRELLRNAWRRRAHFGIALNGKGRLVIELFEGHEHPQIGVTISS
jgi:hypothetical protein